MKFARFLGFLTFFVPCVAFAAGDTEFQNASRLLSAARRGDVQTVQFLINSGVDVNYVDATGLSLVCTAVMNNDTRAIQVLQMYGADASNCDRQIKQYKQKSKVATRGEEYGFFSGLSSTHVLALSAVGVAAVIGGVVLLADGFDKDNNNSGSSSGGGHSGGGGGGSSTTDPEKLFAQNLPYGPGCNGDDCSEDFTTWQEAQDFDYMSSGANFNYLMVARAYNAFVRGYLGMTTIRNESTREVLDLKSDKYPFVEVPGGGKPVNVAMITASGVNATGSAVDGFINWFDESKKAALIQNCINSGGPYSDACRAVVDSSIKTSHKYYNFSGVTEETTEENTKFNLSESESVFGNATNEDTKLAKIIAGWEEGGRTTGDFYGFIPNGQLSVYKIGTGETNVADYKNYAAIYDALVLKDSGEYVSSVVANLSLPAVSLSLDYPTVGDTKIVLSTLEHQTTTAKETYYTDTMIDNYYNLNTEDDTSSYQMPSGIIASGKQSDNAENVFRTLANQQEHILVNPAGHNLYGVGGGSTPSPLDATFENFAPALYNNLQNLFMTVVAVQPIDGTEDMTTIEGYSAANVGTLALSRWVDENDSSIIYSSRVCGLTGTGDGGAINPWCFAAPGSTDLEATAAMAGSIALVESAFGYMSPKQIFLLLALTADGPYLGTNPSNNLNWTTKDGSGDAQNDLVSYLRTMYTLPLDTSDSQYLETFKNVFGYGMINLERATKPGTNIYYFSSNKDTIVSGSGNSYWRGATSGLSLAHASSVLSLTNNQSIRASFFDVIESSDGSVSLPRVWNMTIASNADLKHGFYMGDVLGDFSVDSANKRHNQIGNFSFDMSVSSRAYNDNMNGLDNLRVAFSNEKYDINAQYQHHLTDGESRFNGRANGLLSLVSNAIASGAKYKMGDFAFGTRVFSGTVTDENLLESDPVVSSQFEPGRLGFANGVMVNAEYNNDKFGLNVAFGNMHESDTLLGSYNSGLLSINGSDTQYVDAVAIYKPSDDIKLSMRATFGNTRADIDGGMISKLSDIKSDSYAVGLDVGGFGLTVSLPLAVVDGKMGYDYAEFDVVENNGKYEIAMNNPHVEYIDLKSQKRETRFVGSYKTSVGEFTDAGVGFIYRLNPNNTDTFGNESILMFKIHHRLGI